MSENENFFTTHEYEPTNELSRLNALFTDPYAERTLATARDYNELFVDAEPTREELAATIAELDSEWGILKGAHMKYTGKVLVKSPEDENDVRTIFVDGIDVISNGFYIIREDINLAEVFRVKHHLFANVKDILEDFKGKDDDRRVVAIGDIDNALLELEVASPERAKAWLEISYPNLIEELDYRILNGSGDEGEALLSLRGFDFNKYIDLSDTFTRNCVDMYLNSIIEIDTEVPYSVKVNGFMREVGDNETLYKINIDSALVIVNGLSMQPAYDLDETKNDWQFAASLSVIPGNRAIKPSLYTMPVNSLQTLDSIRSAYYQ